MSSSSRLRTRRATSGRRNWSSPADDSRPGKDSSGLGQGFARAWLSLALALALSGCGQATVPGGASVHTTADAGPVDGDWFVLPIEADPTTLNFISGTDTYQEL